MKIKDLYETSTTILNHKEEDIIEWFKSVWWHRGGAKFLIENVTWGYHGEFSYNSVLYLDCEEIKYPINKVQSIDFKSSFRDGEYGKLHSLKNFPRHVMSLVILGGQSLTKIDLPIQSDLEISLARNKITSLKNIHKYVTCKTIVVWNNPVKDSILGLLMIPGINEIDVGGESQYESGPEYKDFHKALAIVAKYVGKGKAGVLAAQDELIENDLDDFAEV